jgi:hypothetical protein
MSNILNQFILTADERTAAMALNTDVGVDPRACDGAAPGVAINLNDNATNYAGGAVVNMTGKYVTPLNVILDPLCPPALKTYLLDMPYGFVDDDVIYAPILD